MSDGDDFQKFLDENKIDPAAILRDAGAKAGKPDETLQRMMATLDKRMNAYPYSAEDMYGLRVANLSSFLRHGMKGCYDKCAQREDVPFLTVPEGLCFRNCITKVSVYMPTLSSNMEDTSTEFYMQQYLKETGKTGDPWEKSAERLATKYFAAQDQA